MPDAVTIALGVAAIAAVFALKRWQWKRIRQERAKRRREGKPAPIDRLPKWARLPALIALIVIATIIKILL